MDYLKNFGACSKCGQGGYSLPKIKYVPPIKFDTTPNYCSKCGEKLSYKCNTCNGTGKVIPYNLISREDYCSECGRKIEHDDTCYTCNGTGTIKTGIHICTKLF